MTTTDLETPVVTAAEQTAKLSALRVAFPPDQIGKLPKGNTHLDYVGHADVTARLLDVDPLWSWEFQATDEHGLPLLDREGNLWIRLTVCGVTRLGVGDGKSMKERIGDALRNAAMRFGVALELWAKGDRDYAREHGQTADAPPITYTPEQQKTLEFLQSMAPDEKASMRTWIAEQGYGALQTLTDEQCTAARHRAHQVAAR